MSATLEKTEHPDEAEAAEYFTPKELARRVRVTPRTVRAWADPDRGLTVRGRRLVLHAERYGRQLRIPRWAWEEFRAAQNPGGGESAEAAGERRRRQRAAEARLDARLGPGKAKG